MTTRTSHANASLALGGVVALALTASACTSASDGSATDDRTVATPATPTRTAYADLVSGVSSVEQLASEADLIVRGLATDARQTLHNGDPTLPVTYQTIEVTQTLKGDVTEGESIEVRFTGGVVDDGRQRYVLQLENQPQFTRSATYVLMLLGPDDQGAFWPLGGSQGRYEVKADKLLAVPGAADLGGVEATLNGKVAPKDVAELRRIS